MKDIVFLVVDDSATMRRILENTLKRIGYKKVYIANDGTEAITMLKTNKDIDFIITDWNMPYMDGISLVKYIRSHEDYKKLPVLMVTTKGMKDDIIEAMQAGINNYIVKPFTPKTLQSKIDLILNDF